MTSLRMNKAGMIGAALLVICAACGPRGEAAAPAKVTTPTEHPRPSATPVAQPSPTATQVEFAKPGGLPVPPAIPSSTTPPISKAPSIELSASPSPTPSRQSIWLLPDSEIVYGPSAAGFDVTAYLNHAGGALSRHKEYLHSTAWTRPGDIIQRAGLDNSINPRLLLALLEYECGCVLGDATGGLEDGYALGFRDYHRKGLYGQLWWAANQLSVGYYGWRSGRLETIDLPDGGSFRPPASSNAATVALEYYFAQSWAAHLDAGTEAGPAYERGWWERALGVEHGLAALHEQMFGDAWERDAAMGPLIPEGLEQSVLNLPIEPGKVWSLTSGPHPAWEAEGALAALDFAPASDVTGCFASQAWATAAADGVAARAEAGVVALDLDGDGIEQTGWVVIYVHIASEGRVQAGERLRAGDALGHPSCEGGPSTGTHLHIARKYNGEWIEAGGWLPFVMDGWTAQEGARSYEGSLVKGEQKVTANLYGIKISQISRPKDK